MYKIARISFLLRDHERFGLPEVLTPGTGTSESLWGIWADGEITMGQVFRLLVKTKDGKQFLYETNAPIMVEWELDEKGHQIFEM